MKKFLFIGLAFCIVFVALPQHSRADQVSDLQSKIADTQKQRDALLQEQKQIQAQIDAAQASGNTLKSTIATLEASKKKIANSLKVTQSSIDAANLTIQKLALTITQEQSQISTHEAAIAASLRKLSSSETTSFLTDMLTAGNISAIWEDKASLNTVQTALQNQIAVLQNDQEVLAKQKNEKESTKTQLSSLQQQLSGQKQTVESTQSAQSQLLQQTKAKEAAYQKLLADNIAREKAFEDQLFDYQSQLTAAPSSAAPSPRHGLLTWPLGKIVITQQFGKTAFSGRLYASGTHSGTDFGIPVGSAVMSAGKGTVAGMGNTDDEKTCYSYGRWVFIKYDNGLSSIYGHLTSIIVKPGDPVAPGQVVAYSGGIPGAYGSGYSTGPHLHMGLFNSAGVSIQQYTASIGCKNVSIPLANPTDYLDPLAYLPAL